MTAQLELPPLVTIEQLFDQHEVVLFDAYGVLIHHGGPLPGAPELVRRLNREDKAYFILTNDASRSVTTSAARFAAMGLPIPEQRIITSGSLIKGHFADNGLAGARCVVLGPEDSRRYVAEAGGVVVPATDPEASVLVVCDEAGYGFVEAVDAVLTLLLHRIDGGRSVHLVLPNPDLIYPKGERDFGITAGSIAGMLETVLRQRYPGRPDLVFVRLGKPGQAIFAEAARRAGGARMVMLGDQLRTDVRGALEFGIPAALVQGGLDRYEPGGAIRPTYRVPGLTEP